MIAEQFSAWSTDMVDRRHALTCWREIIDSTLMELEIRSTTEPFHAGIKQTRLGPAVFSQIAAGPQLICRSRGAISRSQRTMSCDLVQVQSGFLSYRQDDSEIILNPGDCVLLDRHIPYNFSTTQGRCVVLGMAYGWLGAWLPEPERLVGRRIDGQIAWGKVLSTMLAQLTVSRIDKLGLPPSAIADQLAALLALAGGSVQPAIPKRVHSLIERAREVMNDFAHSPSLDPGLVAAELGISKRYLHWVFASVGLSFCRELGKIRLERSRRMLVDLKFRHVAIGEIAFRCGYVDQSRFSKNFRSYFGVSPTGVRMQLLSKT